MKTLLAEPLTLSGIPYDILEHIFHQVNRLNRKPLKDLASIRLTCRRLNQVVEPLFFRDIVINCDADYFRITQSETQLAALANKQCPASRLTKRLTIVSLSPNTYNGQPENVLQEIRPRFSDLDKHIKSALDALVNLKRVSWHFRNADPYEVAVASLSALPLLKDVCINFEGQTPDPFHLPLRKFSGLEKLALRNTYGKSSLPSEIIGELAQVIANSPLLSHLEVNVRFSKPSVSFHEFLLLESKQELPPGKPHLTHLVLDTDSLCIGATTLPFLRSLTSLDISTSPGQHNAELWKGLMDTKISLTNLKTDVVTSTFIDYLRSYSGLQKFTMKLRIMYRDSDFDFGTTDQVHDLFHSALPMHKDSLTVLSINPSGVMRWRICSKLLKPLYTCQNLVELGLFVADEGSVESFGVTDMVASAANFCQLSILQIFHAGPISVRVGHLMDYQTQMRKTLMDDLASFKISDPERYLFQVTCFEKFFELLPDPVEVGKYRYTLST